MVRFSTGVICNDFMDYLATPEDEGCRPPYCHCMTIMTVIETGRAMTMGVVLPLLRGRRRSNKTRPPNWIPYSTT